MIFILFLKKLRNTISKLRVLVRVNANEHGSYANSVLRHEVAKTCTQER